MAKMHVVEKEIADALKLKRKDLSDQKWRKLLHTTAAADSKEAEAAWPKLSEGTQGWINACTDIIEEDKKAPLPDFDVAEIKAGKSSKGKAKADEEDDDDEDDKKGAKSKSKKSSDDDDDDDDDDKKGAKKSKSKSKSDDDDEDDDEDDDKKKKKKKSSDDDDDDDDEDDKKSSKKKPAAGAKKKSKSDDDEDEDEDEKKSAKKGGKDKKAKPAKRSGEKMSAIMEATLENPEADPDAVIKLVKKSGQKVSDHTVVAIRGAFIRSIKFLYAQGKPPAKCPFE